MTSSQSLFEHEGRRRVEQEAPLADRMRPRTFEEFVGQEHIVGLDRVLRRAIAAGRVPSFILWGPPGSGKTTLARLVAGVADAHFESVSAVTSGVADLRRTAAEARERQGMYGRRTILFVDEIHWFNKSQQDVILPHVEDGTVTFIGATTENPSFEVIGPLLSRSRVFTLETLAPEHVDTIIRRALPDEERGLGVLKVELEEAAREHLVNMAGGDARVALNALETAAHAAVPDAGGRRRIDLDAIADALQRRSPMYDKAGEGHYDTISAFIKSVRGSSPDGALYWLARMIQAGEDPMFIARRLVVLAAEDIGLARPAALTVAVAAQQAVHFLGMPEGRIPLAEATVYLATAPKSNSAYVAIDRALQDAKERANEPVPLHLRNAVTGLMRQLGYGQDYKYSHDYPGHFVEQEFLPPALKDRRYYRPTQEGSEKEIAERMKRWWGEDREPGQNG
ncbi:MAG: replication-associated recombination protein A [Dehalococcoidia bacterium]|jgi:putative ATPase|nr:replication-associated recombination protein A [Dehalococcoidia bacterium]MDP6227435.1 replication-associated recombination protein A [Dehalococcoidia bacterium]MDP7083543.1 replication-associated recombination protein A [Dehalococcoidia bacterium]MDP7199363.1 replication-associated recombination protein A [Dehalococcoidia bacterium]MDP7510041.1 replication-associated recombination protein A [Dehalococcoidia bacterium]